MTKKLMQAAYYEKQGAAKNVIQYQQMPIPQPGAGEVRVKIHASGVNPSDTKSRAGWGGIEKKFERVIPHQDGAGVIESVGENVDKSRVGERVWIFEGQLGRAFGTGAEYIVIPSEKAIILPDNTSFAEGACLGVPAMTAHRTIFADGAVEGQTILVTGGAGAVGNYAIQWGKYGGATVITTVSSPEKAKIAEVAGADYIINYKTEDVVKRIQEITGKKRGINRIVDVDFSQNINVADAVLRTNGGVAMYSANPDDAPALPILSLMLRNIVIRTILVYTMPQDAKEAAIKDITAALKAGKLHHNIAQLFSLTELASAHEAQDSGKMIGKAIVEIS
ncbi:Zn-dependent oxidoreductase, NADPH:quinone reductase [Rivularia sp. PCC 7116]|uniref:NADPH:quinone reductase n=1 Tax=Rivularia sp. PCC 7116 TaxID=373994 RepID=UPI00029F3EB8|nr:NADPH:quinone reductase [Rivularia sp. PCC 7116]AFY57239.1 Zn-dependent oxidoreductase, NADPH:quinone reductase [Rivularia sp. PCC 7116]